MRKIKETVEYYFSDANYYHDTFLRRLEDSEGFIEIERILMFPMMRRNHVKKSDIVEISKYGFNFEIDSTNQFIKKKIHEVDTRLRILGFCSSSVRQFSFDELNKFKELKFKAEKRELKRTSIIITTCLNS
jgi:hypothetical protein